MKIMKESWVIAIIGLADLITTLVWVHHHGAQEANPLFARYLAMGSVWFALMKIVLLAAPLFLLEWAHRRRPVFTRWASRFAIIAYLGFYGVGVLRLNPDLLHRPQEPDQVIVMADTEPTVIAQAMEMHRWQPRTGKMLMHPVSNRQARNVLPVN